MKLQGVQEKATQGPKDKWTAVIIMMKYLLM